MSEWWSLLPALCLALGFAAGWRLRGGQRASVRSPAEEDADDKKKPAEVENRGFFT